MPLFPIPYSLFPIPYSSMDIRRINWIYLIDFPPTGKDEANETPEVSNAAPKEQIMSTIQLPSTTTSKGTNCNGELTPEFLSTLHEGYEMGQGDRSCHNAVTTTTR